MALQNAYAEQGAHHCALRHTQEQAGAVHGEKRIGHNDVRSKRYKTKSATGVAGQNNTATGLAKEK